MKKKTRNFLLACLFWFIIWELLAIIIQTDIFLPSPIAVGVSLCELFFLKLFWQSLCYTFIKIFSGLILALACGIICASMAVKWRFVKQLLEPLMMVIKSVPVASFIILVLIWLSSSNLSILISFLMGLPIIYTNILQGILCTDQNLIEMSAVFGKANKKSMWKIYIYEVYPFLESALTVAIGLCFKAGIAAEVIGLPNYSIGAQLYQSKIYLQTADLFAWTVVVVVLSVIVEKIVLKCLKGLKILIYRK